MVHYAWDVDGMLRWEISRYHSHIPDFDYDDYDYDYDDYDYDYVYDYDDYDYLYINTIRFMNILPSCAVNLRRITEVDGSM